MLAGCSTGLSMLPLKWARHWRWENYWLPYTVVALYLVPAGLAFWLCPGLWNVYTSIPFHAVIRPLFFGTLWGFAYLGAGVCMHRLGFALPGALIGGVGTAVGTLAPLFTQHSQMILETSGLLILMGTGITLLGVALCGWAGYHREQLAKQQGRGAGFDVNQTAMCQDEPTRKGYFLAVLVALFSGVCAAFMNLSLAYGGGIIEKVRQAGAAPQWAPFAVWPVTFLGGSLFSFGYTFFLLFRNNSWGNFLRGPREILNPILGAAMWTSGIALYSSATTYLGVLGVSVGFAIFFIVLMLCGQLVGLVTGEWRQMHMWIYRSFAWGIALLAVAIITFGAANYFSG